ncbi:MAG: multicopper oxidase domain-containing protein, partial [Pseudomonadota bacterium]
MHERVHAGQAEERLRLKRGDRLVVDLQNDSDLFTSIHWHGVSVPYAMDGAGWMVEPVAPGEPFQYTFTVEQAGTFWYHPHFDTARSVDLGLYGVIVVEDPDEPTLEEELVVVLDSVLEAGADTSDQGIEPSPVR